MFLCKSTEVLKLYKNKKSKCRWEKIFKCMNELK